MGNEVDEAVDRAVEQLRTILTSIALYPEEKDYVNEAAPRLERLAYQIVEEIPEERRGLMRMVVLAVAMGMIIAPTLEARRGADMFQPNE